MKNKIKSVLFSIGILILGCVLGACGSNAVAYKSVLNISYDIDENRLHGYIVTDTENDHDYIVIKDTLTGGVAITPRLEKEE